MMRSIAVTYCYDGDGNFIKSSVSNVNKIHKKYNEIEVFRKTDEA